MKKLSYIIFLSLFLFSCQNEENQTEKIFYTTGSVKLGNLNSQNNFIGYTDSFNKTDFGAKNGGKITKINFSEGDYVKAGDLIATLDGQEAKTAVNSTNNVINSLNELKNQTSKMYDEQIIATKSKIDQINTSLEIADLEISQANTANSDTKDVSQNQLKTIQTQIDAANTSLETAKLNQTNSIQNLNQKQNIIYTNSKNSISSSIILGDNIIDFLDNIFGVSEKNKKNNDAFENYLGAKDSAQESNTEKLLSDFMKNFSIIKNNYNNLNSNDDVKNLLEKTNNLYGNDLRNLLKQSYISMQNSVSTATFTDSIIASYKTQIATFQTQNEQVILNISGNYITGLKGSIDSIDNFEKEYKSTTDLLQKQVDLATKQVDVLNQTYTQYNSIGNGQVNDISSKVEIAKKQKETLNNQLNELNLNINALNEQKNAKLKEIDTQISQTNASLQNSEVGIDNSKIYSSISGVVVKKYAEVGQIVGAGTPIISIATNDDIKINIYLGDDDISKIKINDEVGIKIDGIKVEVTGKITNILPTKDKITKKTIVEISVKNTDKKILIGSYSKVYLKNKSNSGLIIPTNAIINNFMQPGVYTIENDKIVFKNIKIIDSDDNNSMIEGIKENGIIVTTGGEYLYDGMDAK